MSDKQQEAMNALDKIKAYLGLSKETETEPKAEEKTDVNLKVEFTLADGTNAEAMNPKEEEKPLTKLDDIAIGASLNVMTAEGAKPIADGEHELENGNMVVTSEGVVVDLLEKKETIEVAEETAEASSVAEQLAEMKNKLAEMEGKYATAMSKVDELTTSNKALSTEVTVLREDKAEALEVVKMAKEALEVANAQPTEKPEKKPNTAQVELSAADKARILYDGVQLAHKSRTGNKIITTK